MTKRPCRSTRRAAGPADASTRESLPVLAILPASETLKAVTQGTYKRPHFIPTWPHAWNLHVPEPKEAMCTPLKVGLDARAVAVARERVTRSSPSFGRQQPGMGANKLSGGSQRNGINRFILLMQRETDRAASRARPFGCG